MDFQIGQLVINFGTVCIIDGFEHGMLRLKIAKCSVNGTVQGGAGQKLVAPQKNCRQVTLSDDVKLLNF